MKYVFYCNDFFKDLLSEETSENLKLPCTQSENLIVNMMGGGEDQGISEAKR